MLFDEIADYIDGNGLVAPNLVQPGTIRGSDNGTMFSSEYYVMLSQRNELSELDADNWEILIRSCMKEPGLTVRSPGDLEIDAPDNIVAILGASKVLNKPSVAQDMLTYGLKNKGFYEPNPKEKINWASFQFRQLQLLFAMYCASNNYKWYKFWLWPLMFYTTLVILVSCINTPVNDTDSRRLCWSLIHAVSKDSFLCRMASKIWWNRLRNDYGDEGYRAVCLIYYQDNHPFRRYAVNPWDIK
jgi:hypothetical protein